MDKIIFGGFLITLFFATSCASRKTDDEFLKKTIETDSFESQSEWLDTLSYTLNVPPAYRSKVLMLDLSMQGLEVISDTLCQFENVKYLSLRHNKIDNINNVSCMKYLISLSVDYNASKTFSDDCNKMQNLKELSLMYSDFKTFPTCICQLKNLEYLYLSHNKTKLQVPDCIATLQNIRMIVLNTNNPDSDESIYTLNEQKRIKALVPWCIVIF